MNKKIINVICIIICTVVGAGFASGKEIYRFFAELGKSGFIGIILSTLFLGIIIFFSLKIITKNKINNNEGLIKIIKAPRIFYYMINVFLLVSFYVMIAGFCSCFKQELNIPKYIPAVILCMILFAIFTKKSEWLAKINTVIAPILIIIIIYIFIKYGWNKESYIVENNSYILQTMVNL